MALNKVKIGSFVEKYSEKCGLSNLTVNDVSGINRDKEFFEPSKQVGANTSNYKVVPPNYFACNLMHVGRDKVLPISMNHTKENKIVSPAYTVFRITDETMILKEYFFMCLKSDEKDRFFWFNTDSSVRDGMDWEVFCDVELNLPSIDIQKKYVAVYKALLHNLEIYQSKLDDLKLVCDAYIENLRREIPCQKLKKYLCQSTEVNNGKFQVDSVRGISIKKEFIYTKADMNNVSLNPYLLVRPNSFCYVPITSRNGDKISIAINTSEETYIVSSSYVVFYINDTDTIYPRYLFLFLSRSEFDRYSRFNSWGSAREAFEWEALCELKIPIPDIKVQKSIVKIHDSLLKRTMIVENLKAKINEICPILINGAIREGGAL